MHLPAWPESAPSEARRLPRQSSIATLPRSHDDYPGYHTSWSSGQTSCPGPGVRVKTLFDHGGGRAVGPWLGWEDVFSFRLAYSPGAAEAYPPGMVRAAMASGWRKTRRPPWELHRGPACQRRLW